jgi:hypothetical protein
MADKTFSITDKTFSVTDPTKSIADSTSFWSDKEPSVGGQHLNISHVGLSPRERLAEFVARQSALLSQLQPLLRSDFD